MKKYIFTILLSLFVLSAAAQKKLTILHTNDTHSCIFPQNRNLADTLIAGRGGFIRRIAMLKEQRKVTPDLLLFDSGDFSQGSPYYTLFKGDVEIGLMNRMGYDAVTIGNHEFDFGLDNMARLFRMAKFPIVCANYDFTGTPVEGLVKPYVIIKRNGIKIGVFGIAPEMKGLVDENKCKGVTFFNPITTANKVATYLKKQKKCDVVICLSHLGWEQKGMGDQAMVGSARNIDIVLGGHSHTYFKQLRYITDLDGNKIPDDQNGKHAVFVGKIVMKLK